MTDDHDSCEWVNVILVPAHLGCLRQIQSRKMIVCVGGSVIGILTVLHCLLGNKKGILLSELNLCLSSPNVLF